MTIDQTQRLDADRASTLQQWKDERILTLDELDSLVWFFKHSWGDITKLGLEMDGFSFRQGPLEWLLVVKLWCETTPQVGFVSSKNPIRCMRKLRELLRANDLHLYDDKYR